ncbi:DUF6262 family protein [Kitasatospora sp. NPDC058478]|uniref:DUF6262 family protein n=1 Tax=unclassified Kitasatospora TaxID=2633591 RepID=UPI00365230B0
MTAKRRPSEVLADARRKDSREKRAKVLAVVEQMIARGDAVTFASVAKTAGVSNWLVYAEGVREHIETARTQQAGKGRRDRQEGLSPSAASLRTDLELSRQEVTALRGERDRLKAALQRQLGQQLDQIGSADLIARVEELTRQNAELASELGDLHLVKSELEAKVEELEDDLAAARSSLRRMIRAENSGPALA